MNPLETNYKVIKVSRADAAANNTIFPDNTIIEVYENTQEFRIGDGATPFNSLAVLGGITGTSVTSVNTRTGAVTLTSADVGLANVTNTTDANKPVSTAQQTALNLKANLASPTFTGVPLAPTAAATDNTTQLATTAFAPKMLIKTASGTGAALSFSIPHGITGITTANAVSVDPNNAASAGVSYSTIDATNVNIFYTVAPVTGTNNLSFSIIIK